MVNKSRAGVWSWDINHKQKISLENETKRGIRQLSGFVTCSDGKLPVFTTRAYLWKTNALIEGKHQSRAQLHHK